MSISICQKSVWVWLGSLLRVPQDRNQGFGQLDSYLETLENQFLEVVGLTSHPQLFKAAHIPSYVAPSPICLKATIAHQILPVLWIALSFSPAFLCCPFKGSCDYWVCLKIPGHSLFSCQLISTLKYIFKVPLSI